MSFNRQAENTFINHSTWAVEGTFTAPILVNLSDSFPWHEIFQFPAVSTNSILNSCTHFNLMERLIFNIFRTQKDTKSVKVQVAGKKIIHRTKKKNLEWFV